MIAEPGQHLKVVISFVGKATQEFDNVISFSRPGQASDPREAPGDDYCLEQTMLTVCFPTHIVVGVAVHRIQEVL